MKIFIGILMIAVAFVTVAFVAAPVAQTIAHDYNWTGKHVFAAPVQFPNYRKTEMDSITSPVTGMVVLVKDSNALYAYKTNAWVKLRN